MDTTTGNYPDTRTSAFVPNALDYVALLLVIIGGLNWGLVGAANIDLVASIFGDGTMASRIVYILVALAALYSLSFLARFSKGR